MTTKEAPGLIQQVSGLTRAQCEDFLFLEAHLLDEWRLDEWFDLFAEGARYEVPPANSEDGIDANTTLFYVSDDYNRLAHRVRRLKKATAHAEFPHSRVNHMVSNVRLLNVDDQGLHVRSAFITHRSKHESTDIYVGHHHHVLKVIDGKIKIAFKRSYLDMLNLRPQGSVSIIV